MPNYTIGKLLKNKVGARSIKKLAKLEAPVIAGRMIELSTIEPESRFDAARLKAIHRHLFQDVYEWAGCTRDEHVRLSDGTVATEPTLERPGSKPFLHGDRIARALALLEERAGRLAESKGLTRDAFAVRAADLLLTLNNIHPFREGNGRTQRLFIGEIAEAVGYPLDFRVITKERMDRASIAGHEDGDRTAMHRLFGDAIDPERARALAKAIAFLDRENFRDRKNLDWNYRYISTIQNTAPLKVTMVGVAGTDFMARAGADILIGRTEDLPQPVPQLNGVFLASRLDPAETEEPPIPKKSRPLGRRPRGEQDR